MSEDVGKIIAEAWKAVESSGVPERLQEAAFNRAFDSLSGGGGQGGGATAGGGGNGGSPASSGKTKGQGKKKNATSKSGERSDDADGTNLDTDNVTTSEDEFFERLIEETKAERELIEDVMSYSPTKPTLNVTGRQLGSTQKQKQVAIAVLLSVARQIGLKENVTSVAVIREECEQFRCADRNLSENIRNTRGLRLLGEKRTKDIQVRNPAFDLFKTEIERITGGGEPDKSDTGD